MAGLWQEIGDAIADIREKVVEEPWFGRTVTERGDAPEWPKAEEALMEPQGLNGEVSGPERETYSYNAPGDNLLERGIVIDQAAQSPEAHQTQPTQMLEDHSRDIDLDR